MQTRSEVQAEAKKKTVMVTAATAATVAVGVLGGPVLAAFAAVPTGVLAWKWWKHRAENGIKF